mgnify:CR=1 FL=1
MEFGPGILPDPGVRAACRGSMCCCCAGPSISQARVRPGGRAEIPPSPSAGVQVHRRKPHRRDPRHGPGDRQLPEDDARATQDHPMAPLRWPPDPGLMRPASAARAATRPAQRTGRHQPTDRCPAVSCSTDLLSAVPVFRAQSPHAGSFDPGNRLLGAWYIERRKAEAARGGRLGPWGDVQQTMPSVIISGAAILRTARPRTCPVSAAELRLIGGFHRLTAVDRWRMILATRLAVLGWRSS